MTQSSLPLSPAGATPSPAVVLRADSPPVPLQLLRQAPTRILMIGALPPPLGGTTVLFQQLADDLAEHRDVDVDVIDTSAASQAGGLRKLVATAGILWQAARRMRAADAVTFHASTPGTLLFGPVIWVLSRLLRRPLVLREFGGSLDSEYADMRGIFRRLLRIAFRADRVLLETHQLLASFRKEFPAAHLEWYANSRPIPKERGATTASRPHGVGLRFAFIGHVKPTKGIPEILRATELLDDEAWVDIYGPFHEGLSEADFRASERVRYCGVLPPEQVTATIREYDAILLPTHHFGEGYPGIILEAYAAGRPVIASRWRAIPEIVEDGVTGLLVEPRDPVGLAEAMQQLIDSPRQLDGLAEGAAKAAERFSSIRWTERFVELCRELSRERRPARKRRARWQPLRLRIERRLA